MLLSIILLNRIRGLYKSICIICCNHTHIYIRMDLGRFRGRFWETHWTCLGGLGGHVWEVVGNMFGKIVGKCLEDFRDYMGMRLDSCQVMFSPPPPPPPKTYTEVMKNDYDTYATYIYTHNHVIPLLPY